MVCGTYVLALHLSSAGRIASRWGMERERGRKEGSRGEALTEAYTEW
jgi:hypothetical protein